MDIAVCGNLTLDELVQDGFDRISPGGTALFASCAAEYLGARARIIGNVGTDYPPRVLGRLTRLGLNLRLLRRTKSPSTRFRIGYHQGSRRLWLLEPGRPITPVWKGGPVQGLHLGPVFDEVSESLALSLRRKCMFMSLDIQGLVRRVNRSSEVLALRRNLDPMLKLCDMVKASAAEAKFQTSSRDHRDILDRYLAAGPKYAIMTLGGRGSLLGVRDHQQFFIPSFPDRSIKDPTGAGDVYVGAWLTSYLWTKDPIWAASVGSAFGSLASQEIGLSKFRISRRELFRRTSWVYNHARQLWT